MGWRIVEVSETDSLRLYLNNINFELKGERVLIPISDIDTIIINNYKLKLTIGLINELTKNNINLIICDNKRIPSSFTIPVKGNHNSLKIMEKQIAWQSNYKAIAWQKIVCNKIANQRFLIKKCFGHCDVFEALEKFENDVGEFDITNREGHAAKVYWNKLFGKSFTRSYDSSKCSIINSSLNYGYAILRSFVVRSIVKKGLDPRIAFFHKSFSNFFALASDLMEPFRPLIDEIVYKNHKLKTAIEMRQDFINIFNKKLIMNDQKQYINNGIDIYVDQIAKGKYPIWVSLWDW